MIKIRKQSSTTYPINFLMVDSTDHVTGKTGLTPTVTLSKNGAAFGAALGAVSEIGSGWYSLAGNATDRNTLGELLVHAAAAGADPLDVQYSIVGYDPFLGVTTLGPGAISWVYQVLDGGGVPIADADIWVTTDIAGLNVIASGRSDNSGNITFYLDAGTYYIWGQKAGYNFANPDTEVVS